MSDIVAGYSQLHGNNDRVEYLLAVWHRLEDLRDGVQGFLDEWYLFVDSQAGVMTGEEKARFAGLSDCVLAAKERRARRDKLIDHVRTQPGWGASYCDHPYILAASQKEGFAQAMISVVHSISGEHAVNAISERICQRWATQEKYAKLTVECESGDVEDLLYALGKGGARPKNRRDWSYTYQPPGRELLLAAEAGCRKRRDLSRPDKRAKDWWFRIGSRGEVRKWESWETPTIDYPAYAPQAECPTQSESLLSDAPSEFVLPAAPPATPTSPPGRTARRRAKAARVVELREDCGDGVSDDGVGDEDEDPDVVAPPKRRRASVDGEFTPREPEPESEEEMRRKCGCTIRNAAVERILEVPSAMHCPGNRVRVQKAFSELIVQLNRPGGRCCKRHLMMAADKAGFYKRRLRYEGIRASIQEYVNRGNRLDEWLTTDEAFAQVKAGFRPPHHYDQMRFLNFEPDPSQNTFYALDPTRAAEILDEINPAIRNCWERDGTVVSGIFRWWEEAGLLGIFREEAHMYAHHLRLPPSQVDQGWLRNCWHSVFQQVMRMDPLYYLLYACLRPDRNTALISYPYYSKLARPGAQTYFRHIDLNVNRALSDMGDDLANIIQGSVSLTDEDVDNCTELIPGLHRRFKEWGLDLRSRGVQVGAGEVNAIRPQHFTRADAQKYGTHWRKEVCQAGDARISSPLLPHGSTGPATVERITALPWKVGLRPGGQHVDILASGTVDEIATAHRNLTHARNSPSGKPNVYGAPDKPFPAAVPVLSSHYITGAQLGRHSYYSFPVKQEQQVLFGGSRMARARLIRHIRADLTAQAKAAWRQVREAEQHYFGANSYFHVGVAGRRTLVQPQPTRPLAVEAANRAELQADEHADDHGFGGPGDGEREDAGTLATEWDRLYPAPALPEAQKAHPLRPEDYAPRQWRGAGYG